MGRGETPKTCEFDETEMRSLQNFLRAMLAYEPSERITANDAIKSEFMLNGARPAWLKGKP